MLGLDVILVTRNKNLWPLKDYVQVQQQKNPSPNNSQKLIDRLLGNKFLFERLLVLLTE